MKDHLWEQHLIKIESGFDPSVSVINNTLVENLMLIWNKASISILSKTRIMQKFRDYHQKYRNLLKPYKERQYEDDYVAKMRKLREDSKKLFDVVACKCDFKSYPCETYRRVPISGRLSHSRWFTTAIIFRLYVASQVPTTNLMILTVFAVKVRTCMVSIYVFHFFLL